MSSFSTNTQCCLEVLDAAIGQEAETGMQIGKEEIEVSLYIDDMILDHKRP